MSPLDVRPDYPLLVGLLRDPGQLATLSASQFAELIDAADHARLLGWLLTESEARALPVDPPGWLQDRLLTVRGLVHEQERAVRWEIDRLELAFSGSGVSWMLLKGAAYVAAGLPPGRGRRVADIDICVPVEQLRDAERSLNAAGWRVATFDPYDERYYREWMHELPPMVHDDRGSVVDLHHAILPRTSRLQPRSERLFERACRVDGGVSVLCPSHMVLHAATHLFHDGEIAGAIRDVVDLDRLLRTFGDTPGFWSDLVQEARVLDLTRPTYYALRYTTRLMQTPVPGSVIGEVAAWAPASAIAAVMDALVERALLGSDRRSAPLATFALYVRSHWLRMPPWLLARHLIRKGVVKRRESTKRRKP